jgi:hypothetical protein
MTLIGEGPPLVALLNAMVGIWSFVSGSVVLVRQDMENMDRLGETKFDNHVKIPSGANVAPPGHADTSLSISGTDT